MSSSSVAGRRTSAAGVAGRIPDWGGETVFAQGTARSTRVRTPQSESRSDPELKPERQSVVWTEASNFTRRLIYK